MTSKKEKIESTGEKIVENDELHVHVDKEDTQEEKSKEEMEVYDIEEEIEVMGKLGGEEEMKVQEIK